MASVLCSCGAEVLYDDTQSRCPNCNAGLAELAEDAIRVQPSHGFRKAKVIDEVFVYQSEDTDPSVPARSCFLDSEHPRRRALRADKKCRQLALRGFSQHTLTTFPFRKQPCPIRRPHSSKEDS